MKAGVIAVQGAVPEHLKALRRTMEQLGIRGQSVPVRRRKDLDSVDCLVLPGGESTTISRLLRRFDIFDRLVELAGDGLPIMGTCAGCVLLAKEGDEEVERTGTELLALMDMAVERNAFGRQRASFETPLVVNGLGDRFPAVFIRAPAINSTWGECRVVAEYEGRAVMARQGSLLAVAFHPELSPDTRLHEMLVRMAMRR